MKKYLYLLFVATAFFSCSKEAQTPDNLRLQMVDKWSYRNARVITYSAQGKATDSTGIVVSPKDFFEFKDDGSFSSTTSNGTELTSGTFNTTSTTIFTLKESGTSRTCRVINLNIDTFIFAEQDAKIAGKPYKETKLTLYR